MFTILVAERIWAWLIYMGVVNHLTRLKLIFIIFVPNNPKIMYFVASLKRCRVLSSSRLVEMQKLNDNFVTKLLRYIICIIILNDISILKFIICYYYYF